MQQRNPLAFSYISPYIQGTRRIKRITHNLKVKSPCIKVYRNPFPLFPVFLLSRDIMCKFLPRFFHTLRKKEKKKKGKPPSLFFFFFFFFFFISIRLQISFLAQRMQDNFFLSKYDTLKSFSKTKEIKFVRAKDCLCTIDRKSLVNSYKFILILKNIYLYLV